MKKLLINFGYPIALAIIIILGGVCLAMLTGCKTQTLEPGGAYAPTNSSGQVIYNDIGLAVADASYKLAYETVSGVFKFERDNRTQLYALSPSVELVVKHQLDIYRTQAYEIDGRWALARKAYKSNPTPAGLSTIQSILLEIQRLIPVVQSQISPINKMLTTTP